MLGAACACALLAAAWQPALRPLQQPAARPSTTTCQRAASADMVLPKAVAVVPFIPWVFVIVTNNLPTELRLKIQKSPLLQRGITLRTMKKEPPKVRPARLTPEVLAITQSFRKQYATKDLEYLWAALLKCYGTKQRALAAIEANPQIVNPSYSFPNTMLESKRLLLGVMTEAEALEVMDKNPAVLQCGPSLEALGPSEIKSFAQLRGLGSRIPAEAQQAGLAVLLVVVVLPVLVSQNPDLADTALLSNSKALAGLLGPLFFGAILYLLKAGGG